MPLPDISEVIFEIGPFALRWYSLAYLVGIIYGWRLLIHIANKPALWNGTCQYSKVDVDDFIPYVTFGIILGGRLGYVLFYNPAFYLANPAEIIAIWKGGMSFHGGFLGVIVAGYIFIRRRNIPALQWLDLMALSVPVGLFLGRIANFINGELWGRPTDLPWAFIFPEAGPAPRHPSQLYEAGLEGLFLFMLLNYMAFSKGALMRAGLISGLFGIGYGVSRFLIEYVREPDGHIGTLTIGLTMGQLLSLPLIIAGFILVRHAYRDRPT